MEMSSKEFWRGLTLCAWVFAGLAVGPVPAGAAGAAASSPAVVQQADATVLHDMSRAFEALANRISPAVVELRVSAYGTDDPESRDPDAPIGREQRIGSGVIVDPDGYIVTNNHVIKWARQIHVVLTPRIGVGAQATTSLRVRPRLLTARVVGYSTATDLAVLKVDAGEPLPAVPFAKYDRLHQGQIVLALGSPLGLNNSVSLGLVSAVVRQGDPDSPMVYIQTDAAINPGNSGGALVDVDGNLAGINSSILSESGGNEGIGFAIPSGIVRYVYRQIRAHGYVPGGTIGASVQAITPELAQALGLSSDAGVIVSDVGSGGPAAGAGLRLYDRIVSMDGVPIDSVPTFVMNLYLRGGGDHVRLGVIRGSEKLSLEVSVVAGRPGADSLADMADLARDGIAQLGIFGIDLSDRVMGFLPQDVPDMTGVVVAAIASGGRAQEIGLRSGDVIGALNAEPVQTVAALRTALKHCKSGAPAVLQVMRDGRWALLMFEVD